MQGLERTSRTPCSHYANRDIQYLSNIDALQGKTPPAFYVLGSPMSCGHPPPVRADVFTVTSFAAVQVAKGADWRARRGAHRPQDVRASACLNLLW